MASSPKLDSLRPALEALALCRQRDLRERLFFETVHGLELALALGLWRRIGRHGLVQVLSRGAVEFLPSEAEVEAVLAGELPAELPHQKLVLAAPPDAEGNIELALAFGGLDCDEEAVDFVEAVLLLWRVVSASDPDRSSADTLPSPSADREALRSEGNRLAHDLRNLLQCIVGNQDVVDSSPEGADEHLVERLEQDVDRAAALLRTATGRPPEATSKEDAEVIANVCEGERPACAQAGIELRFENTVEAGARGALSNLELERVVRNLLVNSRRAMLEAGRKGLIEVVWERVEGGFTLRVQDQGPGLNQHFHPGFGLSSVRALTESVGGMLAWKNLPTSGAEFTITLPGAAS